MRPANKKIFVLPIAFLFAIFLNAQETITITLLVDTANLATTGSVKTSCTFNAVYSKSGLVVNYNGNPEDFKIDAEVDDEIIWEAVSTSSANDIIDIKKIVRENNSRIFKDKENRGKKHGQEKKETVRLKIKYNTIGKEDYKYKISFKINNKGKPYKIDPKIKVGSLTD